MYLPRFQLPPLLAVYLFFGWFSIFPQILFFVMDITGWAGLRNALLYNTTWLLIPALFAAPLLSRILLLFGSIAGLCALAKLGNFVIFGQEISQSVFMATLETNPNEAREFFQHYLHWWMLPMALVYLAPAIWLYHHAKRYEGTGTRRVIIGSVVLYFLIQPFITKGFDTKGYSRLLQRFETVEPWGMLQNYTQYLTNIKESGQMQTNMEAVARNATVSATDASAEQTYVLIIGESTARARLSLYGYSRNTNPELEAIRDQLLIYTDVAAVIPYTIESLSSTISFTDPEEINDMFHNMNLITLMKNAGFKTYWITNQQSLSERNTLLTALANLSDETTYLNNNRQQSSSSYDEVVLAPFQKALDDKTPRKLIILHLIGTHFAYQYRYPESYDFFKDDKVPTAIPLNSDEIDIYNQYDNAVRYNDHVVRRIIDTYKATDPYGFLMYFSDHGEEVYDSRKMDGRSMSEPTPNMYDVPFIIWPSPRWASNYNVEALKSTVNRPASQRDFLNGWCDLARIQYKECNPERSLFNAAYKPQERFVGISSDRHKYDDLRKPGKLSKASNASKSANPDG
jgi:heptose-I-phosphate ethanolaminephosphotransferase